MYSDQAMQLACSRNLRPWALFSALGRKILDTSVGQLEWLHDQEEEHESWEDNTDIKTDPSLIAS